jgi:hypothetical protein
MPAKDAALSLIRLASALPDSTAQAIATNFVWSLITCRTSKASQPALTITIKFPCMSRECVHWRNQIFESVDLSSEADPPLEQVHHSTNTEPATARWPLLKQPPWVSDPTPVEHTSMKHARAFGSPPKHTSMKAASVHTSMKDAATLHTPMSGAPPMVLPPPVRAADDTAAAMHQNLLLVMMAYFQGKATKPSKDDDSLDPKPPPPSISKFTEWHAAPFFVWARI